jgi:hypothetical protein
MSIASPSSCKEIRQTDAETRGTQRKADCEAISVTLKVASDMTAEKKHDDAAEMPEKPQPKMRSYSEVTAKIKSEWATRAERKAAQAAGRELTPAERDAARAEQEAADLERFERSQRDATGTTDPSLQGHLVGQVVDTIWGLDNLRMLPQAHCIMSTMAMLKGIQPQDALEGMLAAQMVATNNTAMECLRRAALGNQTLEGREMNLKHAAKLMALFSRQVEGLDKHRGKGQQKVTVEHVHVQAGGQAIVGHVEAGGKPEMRPGNGRAQAVLVDAPSIAFDIVHAEEADAAVVPLAKVGQMS